MVYWTATLPTREEEEFYGLVHIPREQIFQFRGRTSRPNVGYQVQREEMGGEEEEDEEEEEDVLGLKTSKRGLRA